MRHENVYSAKNVISLVVVFCVIFWLIYSIGSFLHESRKISTEIEEIRKTNTEIEALIEDKKKEQAYLKTQERIEKEAKMQMGKKLPGEQVLVFIEEKLELLPSEERRIRPQKRLNQMPNWKKWYWVFWGNGV